MGYGKYATRPPEPFYTLDALDDSIGLSADMGAYGFVIWGNNDSQGSKYICLATKDYLETVLGPYATHVLAFYHYCSDVVCNGHGRCRLKDLESGRTRRSMRPLTDYTCTCYQGFTGEGCSSIDLT